MSSIIFLPVEYLKPTFFLRGHLLVEIWGFLRHINDVTLTNFLMFNVLILVSCIAKKVIEMLLWHMDPLRSCATTVGVFISIVEERKMASRPGSRAAAECLSESQVFIQIFWRYSSV
jgi:hypothetical protein